MVQTKEYRICMPLTVEEYRIGQLYMIARHSHEQSENGEGVEVVANQECEDPVHGKGQFTEKRIHLSSRLPYWVQAFVPKVFYITEKAWNYYPYTITEYRCSFIPKLLITIQTRFEDNNGSNDNCLGLTPEELSERDVVFLDIAYDEVSSKHYKEEEDPCYFRSEKTGRGPLVEGWMNTFTPIMCSYKLVKASFEVWGLQTKTEEFIHSIIQHTLVLGHRQAFAWIDDWISMTIEDVRAYEARMHEETNTKVSLGISSTPQKKSVDDEEDDDDAAVTDGILPSPLSPTVTSPKSTTVASPNSPTVASPKSPTSPLSPRSWFSWS